MYDSLLSTQINLLVSTIYGLRGLSTAPLCKTVTMPASRRFPPPWMIEEHAESFIVRDANGQALGYVLLRRRAAAPLSDQPADPRRGPPHGGELRQAADPFARKVGRGPAPSPNNSLPYCSVVKLNDHAVG